MSMVGDFTSLIDSVGHDLQKEASEQRAADDVRAEVTQRRRLRFNEQAADFVRSFFGLSSQVEIPLSDVENPETFVFTWEFSMNGYSLLVEYSTRTIPTSNSWVLRRRYDGSLITRPADLIRQEAP